MHICYGDDYISGRGSFCRIRLWQNIWAEVAGAHDARLGKNILGMLFPLLFYFNFNFNLSCELAVSLINLILVVSYQLSILYIFSTATRRLYMKPIPPSIYGNRKSSFTAGSVNIFD